MTNDDRLLGSRLQLFALAGLHRGARAPRGAPHAHPRRPAADQRPRRGPAPHDPRRVLAPAFARYLHLRFTGLRQELEPYLDYFNCERVHHGRLTRGRIPGELVYGARKMEAR
jgi:hypothetical protein